LKSTATENRRAPRAWWTLMWESFFGFKKTPFSDSSDAKPLFASAA
jgi:hypothetical protein